VAFAGGADAGDVHSSGLCRVALHVKTWACGIGGVAIAGTAAADAGQVNGNCDVPTVDRVGDQEFAVVAAEGDVPDAAAGDCEAREAVVACAGHVDGVQTVVVFPLRVGVFRPWRDDAWLLFVDVIADAVHDACARARDVMTRFESGDTVRNSHHVRLDIFLADFQAGDKSVHLVIDVAGLRRDGHAGVEGNEKKGDGQTGCDHATTTMSAEPCRNDKSMASVLSIAETKSDFLCKLLGI
jgi:hypothetical protein